MRRRRLLAGLAVPSVVTDSARAQIVPFPIPREPLPLALAWTGALDDGAASLAGRLGYQSWSSMASGLPFPEPRPIVGISVGFAAASPAEIVSEMNRQAGPRAIVILDPEKRFVGVVHHG